MYILYYKKTCPYCSRTLEAIADKDIVIELRDIQEEHFRLELIERGGKQQVPYLYSEEKNVSMYESGDIIEFLKGDLNVGLPEGATCPMK